MSDNSSGILSYFPTLQNSEEYYDKLTSDEGISQRTVSLSLLLMLFGFLYGVVMGSYHSFAQAITAGIKIDALFLIVLVICFPAFFIIQFILGSKLRLAQMVAIILSGFVLTSAIMLSFAPIIVIFLLTGANYYFLQLLHIAVFLLSGIFGMKTVVDALKYSCEKKSIYPKVGVDVFRFWVVILVFVGIQIGWNLRPFLGDRGQPFTLFRDYEGNFYTALIYSVDKLVEGDDDEVFRQRLAESAEKYKPAPDSTLMELFEVEEDSVE